MTSEERIADKLLSFMYGDITTDRAKWLAKEQARSLIVFLDSLGFVQRIGTDFDISVVRYQSILPAQEIRCGAYADQWKELGKPEGWQGCSLPKGHSGYHTDKLPAQEGK
jgi:hypothetical protein